MSTAPSRFKSVSREIPCLPQSIMRRLKSFILIPRSLLISPTFLTNEPPRAAAILTVSLAPPLLPPLLLFSLFPPVFPSGDGGGGVVSLFVLVAVAALTVTSDVSEIEPLTAETVVVPVANALKVPELLIVPTEVLLEVQLTLAFIGEPDWSNVAALKPVLLPTVRDGFKGVTFIVVKTGVGGGGVVSGGGGVVSGCEEVIARLT